MADSLVFVTGSSGFIGAEIVNEILKAGYHARLSVRRADQTAEIQARYPDHASQLEFVVIPDLSNAAAVQSALDGVDYVVHVASPMAGGDVVDLQTGFIDPAVKGVTTILDAVAAAPKVKRLVITSSILSLVPLNMASDPRPQVIDEGANRQLAVDLTLVKDSFSKYHVSKLLAHRATIEWAEKKTAAGDVPHFDIATVHPTYVLGYNRTRTNATPSGSNGLFLRSLSQERPFMLPWFVDVRDVAAIHLRILTATALKPRGEVTEFIADGKPAATWEPVAAIVKSKYPALAVKLSPPFTPSSRLDSRRAERDLGIQWHNIADSVSSLVDQQLALVAAEK